MQHDADTFLFLALLAATPAHAEEHIIDDSGGAPGFTTSGDDWTTWGTNGYGYDSSDSGFVRTEGSDVIERGATGVGRHRPTQIATARSSRIAVRAW
jgi:hypothetical protein